MESFMLITALLLCNLSWISVSGSQSQTVEVQPGEDVTLLCDNIYKKPTQTDWFRVVDKTKPSCISSMYGSEGNASFCDGFNGGKFEMSSNVSTVSLKIKRVDLSDSGLYFCGFYMGGHTVISTATHLNIQGNSESDGEVDLNAEILVEEPDGKTNLMIVILAALTVFLTILVIVLAVKVIKLQTAVNEEPQAQRNENLDSDELNYAALSFQAKPKRSRRPATQRELEPNVVYAATR